MVYILDGDITQVTDTNSSHTRYNVYETIYFEEAGQHTLTITSEDGTPVAVSAFEVLPAIRQNSLGIIIGFLLGMNLLLLGIAWLIKPLFQGLADKMTTKNSIYLALVIYIVVAFWGYFLNSTVEFWFLAWMVAVVQGGSQALSRSMYASMTPAAKSGEFFGFFGVMEKFASLIGPLLFAAAGILFGSSRPAVASLSVLFVLGLILLSRVDEVSGRKVADEENKKALVTE
jgi:UMF1 family MFS transporter